MTKELKQAAQAALEALEEIALAGMSGTGQESEEGLRDWHARQAWKFIGIAARELEPLRRALTQRPAAQAEREAFESRVTLNSIIKQYRIKAEDAHWLRASLPTQPAAQATPDQFADASKLVAPVALRSVHLTRDTVGMCIVRINGRVAIRDNGDIIDHTATLEWFADTQQATPEPVGEAVAWWYIEDGEEKFGHPNGYRPDDARPLVFGDTRPAPGVPEGFALVPVEPTLEMLKAMESQWLVGSQVDMANREYAAMLAAAQAKGADK